MVDTQPAADGEAIPEGQTTTEEADNPTGSEHADQMLRLELEVAQLREALLSARHIGMVIGILAVRCNVTTDQSWELLVQLSQRTNVKLAEVARVLHEDFDRHPALDDATLLARIAAKLSRPIRTRRPSDPGAAQPDKHVPLKRRRRLGPMPATVLMPSQGPALSPSGGA